MADDWNCILCGEPIGMWDKTCKHCGEKQFGENDEYYPDEKSLQAVRTILKNQSSDEAGFLRRLFGKKQKQPIFSKEERFVYGIHPDDEIYRKNMELDILSKNYKE